MARRPGRARRMRRIPDVLAVGGRDGRTRHRTAVAAAAVLGRRPVRLRVPFRRVRGRTVRRPGQRQPRRPPGARPADDGPSLACRRPGHHWRTVADARE